MKPGSPPAGPHTGDDIARFRGRIVKAWQQLREKECQEPVVMWVAAIRFLASLQALANLTPLWQTLDEAPRQIAHKGLMQRREQMVGDAVSLSDDAMHWNRVLPNDDPTQIPLDFEFDVMLRRNEPTAEIAA